MPAREDAISVLAQVQPGLHLGWIGMHHYFVVDRWEFSPYAGRIECQVVPELEARDALERFALQDGLGSDSLRRLLLNAQSGDPQLRQMDDRQVLELVLDELNEIRGRLVMVKVAVSVPHHPIPLYDWADVASSAKAAEPAPPSETEAQWIEFEVLDGDGDPVAALPFAMTLPDETERSGALDSDGYTFVDGMEAGNCTIQFREEEPPEKQKPGDWVEIGLVGENGKPCANWEYELKLPDGSAKRGRLDERGQAYAWVEEGEECQVRFIDPEAPLEEQAEQQPGPEQPEE